MDDTRLPVDQSSEAFMSTLQEVLCVVFLKCTSTLGDIGSTLRKKWLSLNPIVLQTVEHIVRVLKTTWNDLVEWHRKSPKIYTLGPKEKLMMASAFVLTIMFLISFVDHLRKRKTEKKIRTVDRATLCDLAKTAYDKNNGEVLMDTLKKNKIHVNKQLGCNRLSIFLCACLSGERKIVKHLLKHHDGDTRQKSMDGDGALYLATYGVLNSSHPDTGLLTDLIKAGCGVNEQNDKGYTCLHRAASKGNVEVIRCLLDQGADPYITNNSGIYPLDSATNAGHADAATLLKIELEDNHGWDLLDPHTPPHIRLGLQSPGKSHLLESTLPTQLRPVKQNLT